MAVYKNLTADSPLASAEFTPVSDGNLTFFTLRAPEQKEAYSQWLTSKEIGQQIVGETLVSGQPVLITFGDKTKGELEKAIAARGDKLAAEHIKKPFNAWAIRGGMSVVAHTLSLITAFLQVEESEKGSGVYVRKGVPIDKFVFSALNQAANFTNIMYGGQKSDDVNQLNFLKKQFNEKIDSHLPDGQEPLDPNDQRAKLRHEEKEPKTFGQKFDDFMRANSVRIGEIGLRYVGTLGLAFPVNRWKPGIALIKEGRFGDAFKRMHNPDRATFIASLGYITGKGIALFTKVPDPYSHEPHSSLDTFREKYLFRIGSLIESASGATIAKNEFSHKQISFSRKGQPIKPMRDYLGASSGVLFSGGYLVRLFAPFGSKALNMDELNAHVTDSLAMLPPEKLPKLVAETAAALTEHFKDKHAEFGKIYTQLMTDLYRYHHIALHKIDADTPEPAVASQPEQGHAERIRKQSARAEETTGPHEKSCEERLQPGRRRIAKITGPIEPSYKERLQRRQEAPEPTLSV